MDYPCVMCKKMADDIQLSFYVLGKIDYAHEGTGFPTWHRLFLLWLEREIQIATNNHRFRLPYWDWSDPSQREILFQRDRLGENVNGIVMGDLFSNWKTYCWTNPETGDPTKICNPKSPSYETLRRCPSSALCNKNNSNWPSESDVDNAVSITSYDAYPYNRYVTGTHNSFRNYMEGFIVESDGCEAGDTLCTPGNPAITRKLHNTVSEGLFLLLKCFSMFSLCRYT